PAMLPMSKIRRTLLPLLWMLGATVTSFSQSNPPPDDYDEDDYPPYDEPCCGQNCESEGTCQLAPCPATGSLYFSIGLGRTPFERKSNFVRAAVIPTYGVKLGAFAHRARSFEQMSAYYRQSPTTARRQFRLWIEQENITSSSYLPSALTADPEALAEKITVSRAIRQILRSEERRVAKA